MHQRGRPPNRLLLLDTALLARLEQTWYKLTAPNTGYLFFRKWFTTLASCAELPIGFRLIGDFLEAPAIMNLYPTSLRADPTTLCIHTCLNRGVSEHWRSLY